MSVTPPTALPAVFAVPDAASERVVSRGVEGEAETLDVLVMVLTAYFIHCA